MKPIDDSRAARIYFTDFFGVSSDVLADYGAFNVACIVDLPLFIDPFLLFTSRKHDYQALNTEIIRYLTFLRDRSVQGSINDGLLQAWYCFPEEKQNRLGFYGPRFKGENKRIVTCNKRTAVLYQGNEQLLMNNLRIKGRQIFRLGSTNQPSYNQS